MTAIDFGTASQLFSNEVTLKFQNAEKLGGTIVERHGVVGDGVNVPISDLIEMHSQTFAPVDIPVSDVDQTNVMIIPYNYALKTTIGGGERTLFAYDLITDHARLHAKAIGRMLDYIKIQAVYTYAGFANLFTVPATLGYNTGMNSAKLTFALSYLEDQSVDVTDYNLSLWMPAIGKAGLLDDPRVSNFFYNNARPLEKGRISDYMGIDIRGLGSNGINAIPYTSVTAGTPAVTTNTYLCPLVAHDSMMQTFNRDPQTRIVWVDQQDRYELLSVMTSGCMVIQPNGIALIGIQNPYTVSTTNS